MSEAGDAADSTPAKSPAPKDKQCPFCNHPFTSSSLGRHLDLYIKEKNPKPPDGIHIVEEIRKLRGGITRRQARNSSTKKDDSRSDSISKPSPTEAQPSPSVARAKAEQAPVEKPAGPKVRFNEAGFEVTGVIRNIPRAGRSDDQKGYEARRIGSVQSLAKEAIVKKERILESFDNGRSAELALRELLGSLKAAR
jgi:hypothetical protein